MLFRKSWIFYLCCISREIKYKLFEIKSYAVESGDRYLWQMILLKFSDASNLQWVKRKWCHSEVTQNPTSDLSFSLAFYGFEINLTFL